MADFIDNLMYLRIKMKFNKELMIKKLVKGMKYCESIDLLDVKVIMQM